MLPPLEARQVRGPEDAVARPVGRLAGRRRAHLPQHQRVGAARRPRADAVLRAATRTWCGRAAATNRSRATTTRSTRCGRCDQTPGVNRGYQAGVLRPDGTLAQLHVRRARRLVYRGDRLPAELYGNVFVAEPAANLVSRIIVSDDGTTLQGEEGVRAGRVPRVDRRAVPAGVPVERARRHALRRRHVPRHHPAPRLHHRVPARSDPVANGLEQPIGHGRIYRIVHDDDDAAIDGRRCRRRRRRSSSQMLSHPNGWWRDTAQRLLVERGDPSVVPALDQARRRPRRTRDAAARAVDARRHGQADPEQVKAALKDSSRDVRTSALRLSERWLSIG